MLVIVSLLYQDSATATGLSQLSRIDTPPQPPPTGPFAASGPRPVSEPLSVVSPWAVFFQKLTVFLLSDLALLFLLSSWNLFLQFYLRKKKTLVPTSLCSTVASQVLRRPLQSRISADGLFRLQAKLRWEMNSHVLPFFCVFFIFLFSFWLLIFTL